MTTATITPAATGLCIATLNPQTEHPTIQEFLSAITSGKAQTSKVCSVVDFVFRGIVYSLVITTVHGRNYEKFTAATLRKEFYFHPELTDDEVAALIDASTKDQASMDAALKEATAAIAGKFGEQIAAKLIEAGYRKEDAEFLADWIRTNASKDDRMVVEKLSGIMDLIYGNQLIRKGCSEEITAPYQRLVLDVITQVLEGETDAGINPVFLDTMLKNNRRGYQWTTMAMLAENFRRDRKYNKPENFCLVMKAVAALLDHTAGTMPMGEAMPMFGELYRQITGTPRRGSGPRFGSNRPEEWSPSRKQPDNFGKGSFDGLNSNAYRK